MQPLQVSDQEIVEMIFFPVVNEASRVLQERIVQSGGDLDIASVLSMGFPPYRSAACDCSQPENSLSSLRWSPPCVIKTKPLLLKTKKQQNEKTGKETVSPSFRGMRC